MKRSTSPSLPVRLGAEALGTLAFTPTFSGIAPADVPAFIAAQAAGALAATGISMILFA